MADTAQNRNFTEEMMGVWPLDKAIEWINGNLSPEDVFDRSKLEDWANENGFSEDED